MQVVETRCIASFAKFIRYKKTPVLAEVPEKLILLIMLFLHLLPVTLFCLLQHRM